VAELHFIIRISGNSSLLCAAAWIFHGTNGSADKTRIRTKGLAANADIGGGGA